MTVIIACHWIHFWISSEYILRLYENLSRNLVPRNKVELWSLLLTNSSLDMLIEAGLVTLWCCIKLMLELKVRIRSKFCPWNMSLRKDQLGGNGLDNNRFGRLDDEARSSVWSRLVSMRLICRISSLDKETFIWTLALTEKRKNKQQRHNTKSTHSFPVQICAGIEFETE